jgi:hypothetical protein
MPMVVGERAKLPTVMPQRRSRKQVAPFGRQSEWLTELVEEPKGQKRDMIRMIWVGGLDGCCRACSLDGRIRVPHREATPSGG